MTAKKKKAVAAGDDSFETLYEEGMQLAQRCQELLTGVEQRIETLRQAFEEQSLSGGEQGP